jgi:xylulokinase
VRYEQEIEPDPAWSDVYARMQAIFQRIHAHAQPLYDELDRL